jgi:hypothetical protein
LSRQAAYEAVTDLAEIALLAAFLGAFLVGIVVLLALLAPGAGT